MNRLENSACLTSVAAELALACLISHESFCVPGDPGAVNKSNGFSATRHDLTGAGEKFLTTTADTIDRRRYLLTPAAQTQTFRVPQQGRLLLKHPCLAGGLLQDVDDRLGRVLCPDLAAADVVLSDFLS